MAALAQKVMSGEYEVPYNHPSPVILDIGANIGSFAAWASERWPGGKIHCYEPHPENFKMLQANLSPIAGRVEFHHFAIGDPSHTRLRIGLNNCGECSFFELGEQSSESVEVTTQPPTVLPQAQILKLDTEGAEIEILEGLAAIEFDVVLVEYHSEENRRRLDALLSQYALIGGEISCLGLGVLKYLHRRILPEGLGHQLEKTGL